MTTMACVSQGLSWGASLLAYGCVRNPDVLTLDLPLALCPIQMQLGPRSQLFCHTHLADI